MQDLLLDMLSHYGLSEIDGPLNNPHILEFFHEIGYTGVDSEETAWCSSSLNYFAKHNGYERSGKLDARSWLKVGDKITEPKLGDVVVFWRNKPDSWEGHVALYINSNDKFIWVIGGNQSNQINVTAYSKDKLLGYRRLKKIST